MAHSLSFIKKGRGYKIFKNFEKEGGSRKCKNGAVGLQEKGEDMKQVF